VLLLLLQMVLCCKDGRLFISDIERCQLVCELAKPTVDVATLGQPLQPLAFTTAEGGRSVFAVGMLLLVLSGLVMLVYWLGHLSLTHNQEVAGQFHCHVTTIGKLFTHWDMVSVLRCFFVRLILVLTV